MVDVDATAPGRGDHRGLPGSTPVISIPGMDVSVWYGPETGHFWAYMRPRHGEDFLLEGRNPAHLATLIAGRRPGGWALPPSSPRPPDKEGFNIVPRFDESNDDSPTPPAPRLPDRPRPSLAEVYCVVLDYDALRLPGPAENATMQLDPQTPQVVRDLRAAALAVLVTSDSVPEQLRDRMLRQAGIYREILRLEHRERTGDDDLDTKHFRELVDGSGYPAPDIAYVGTRWDTGIRHALAAGTRAVLVSPEADRPSAMPQWVSTIRHLRDLPGLLATAKAIR